MPTALGLSIAGTSLLTLFTLATLTVYGSVSRGMYLSTRVTYEAGLVAQSQTELYRV